MGTLPPNLLSDSMLTGLPVGRFCQMYRDKPLPDLGLGPGFSTNPPVPSAVWYAGTPLTIWDEVEYDYGGGYSRASPLSGSGPYVTGTPGPEMYFISVTAGDRPVPFLAWFDIFTFVGDFGPGYLRNRFGLMQRSRDGGDDPSYFRSLCTAEEARVWDVGGYHSFVGTGMGVVPPYQTHEVFVGWDQGDVSGTYTGAPIFQDFGGEDWARRNFFGVLTF